MSVGGGGGGGSGGGDPPGKKGPWWVTDPQDGADAELVDAWRKQHTPGWPGLWSDELYGPGDWDLLGEDYSIPSDYDVRSGAKAPEWGEVQVGGAIDVTGATKGKGR